jgi:hypothetical protein
MTGRRVHFRVWAVVAALAVSATAKAQVAPQAVNLFAAPCAALTVLAPDPPKAQEIAAAVAAAAVAAAASTPAAAVAAATAAATQAVTNFNAAAFKVPRPMLKQGATAEWSSKVEVTFDPPIGAPVAKCLEGDLVLFLDHYPLGLTPIERIRDDRGVATLAFRINRPSTSTPGWTELLAKVWASGGTLNVTVGIGVGNTEIGVAREKLKLTLGAGDPQLAWGALAGSLLLLAAVWRWSKILQDRRDGHMSYSVSRLLLSCWVLTTICAVLMTVLRTGAMPSAAENGLAFLLAISGATTGLSALIDLLRKPQNSKETRFWEDFFDDADGLALHRVQIVVFNFLILYLVWQDLIQLGTIARIDVGWATLLGASAMTFVFGKSGESIRPAIPPAQVIPPAQLIPPLHPVPDRPAGP